MQNPFISVYRLKVQILQPEKVEEFQIALNGCFQIFVDTSTAINSRALQSLTAKLNSPLQEIKLGDIIRPLPGRRFSFWNWFYEVMKFTKVSSPLKRLWDNNLVYGFLSRGDCSHVLSGEKEGY